MKKVRKINIFCLLLLITISACVKNMGSIRYINDKPNKMLKRMEPFLVTVNNPGNNTIIRWTIDPTAGTSFSLVNGQDTAILAFFQFSGVYRITVSYFTLIDTTKAYDSSYSIVTVNDSIYISPPPVPGGDSVPIAGDQITLAPIPLSNSNLELYGQTTRLYKCSSVVGAYGETIGATTIFFDFSNAQAIYTHQDSCGGAQRPAELFLPVGQLSPGLYSLLMNFNQVSYQGSVLVTDSNYVFTWNYTSGIIISPLKVNK